MAIASASKPGGLVAVAGVVGALGLIGVFVAKLQGNAEASQSYLIGFLMWMVLTLGFLGLMILIHLVRARWGYPILAFVHAGAKMLPLMALLFVPILFFLPDIYAWARPEDVARDSVLQHRAAFLNPAGFAVRGIVYFTLWCMTAWLLAKWSGEQERTGDANLAGRRSSFSAAAAVLFVLTVTLSVTDWIMSLESHWYSTMFGLLLVAGELLTALALAIAYLAYTSGGQAVRAVLKPKHFHDLGTMLFTLVVFWAYLAFSQYLIIWSGNLPEEITYYAARDEGAWSGVGGAVIFLHFMLPFLILLSARAKTNPKMIGGVAVGLLVMRAMETLWAVAPSLHRTGPQLNWIDAAAFLGVGGVWVAVFLMHLRHQPSPPRYALESMEADNA